MKIGIKVRVYIKPRLSDLDLYEDFERVVARSMPDMDTSHLRSEGFVIGTVPRSRILALENSSAVAGVREVVTTPPPPKTFFSRLRTKIFGE